MVIDHGSCDHQIVYYGVTNINYEKRTIGSVDIWRCVKCKEHFCEEKQLGIDTLVDEVGMPKIRSDQKWSVVVCNLKKTQRDVEALQNQKR